MPPECGHLHPEVPLECELDRGHKGNHQKTLKSGVISWEQAKTEKSFSRDQIKQMMDDHEAKLQQTLDAAGTGSRESDMIRTMIPIMQVQLNLIKYVLNATDNDS